MSGCEETTAELSAYLDGELPASDRARIEAHLVLCAACNAELTELEETRNALKKLPKRLAPKRIAEKISAEIRAAQPAAKAANVTPIVFEAPQRRSILRFVPYGISAAALLAVALTLYTNRDKNTDLVSKAPASEKALPLARADSATSSTESKLVESKPAPDAPAGKGAAGFKMAPGASDPAGGRGADAPSQLAAQIPDASKNKERDLAEEQKQTLERLKPKKAAGVGEADVDEDFPRPAAPAPTTKKRGSPSVATLAPEAAADPVAPTPAAPVPPPAPGAVGAPKAAEKKAEIADRAQLPADEFAKTKKEATDGAVANKKDEKSKEMAFVEESSGGTRRRLNTPAPDLRKELKESVDKQADANSAQRAMVFEFRTREPEVLARQLQREVEARGARWVVVTQASFGTPRKLDSLQRTADADKNSEKKDEGGAEKPGIQAEEARSFRFAGGHTFDVVAAPAMRQELMQMLNDMKVNAERRIVAKTIEPEVRGGGGGVALQTKTPPASSVATDPKGGAAGQTRVTGEAVVEGKSAATGAPNDETLRAKSGTAAPRVRNAERSTLEPLIRIEIIKE